MKKLLITDLDDTLYNWLDFFIPSFYAMVDELVKITGIKKETLLKEYKQLHQYCGSVEYPFTTLKLPSLLEVYKGYTEDQVKNEIGEAFHKFNSIRKSTLKLFPHVEETLKNLIEYGITIIGYTESSQENGFYRLKKLEIDHYFKHVYSTKSTYEASSYNNEVIRFVNTKKPDKNVLLDICTKENCSPFEAVYVGDSLTKDVYMAIEAGISSVWINYPKVQNNNYSLLVDITSWTDEDFIREKQLKQIWNDKKYKPDFVISDFGELVDIMLNNKRNHF